MGRISVETRRRIILFRTQGHSVKAIRERLQEEGIVISKCSIYKLIKKYAAAGTVGDLPKKRAKILKEEHLQFINESMEKNDELTSKDLTNELLKEWPDLSVSVRTVRRSRWNLGWRATRPNYCQLVREANKKKRLDWCKDRLSENEQFGNVIFTDECSVQLDSHGRLCFRKKNEPRKLKPKPKHPVKVHIWGGISKKGATQLVIFQGTLKATHFCTIIEHGLLPFIRQHFTDGDYRFQQDNDPKHTSRLAQSFLEDHDVNWWRTPAESPDLNPIENVWGSLKYFLRTHYKPTNLETLVEGIIEFWKTLTPTVCTKYISHLHKVMPKVVAVNGEASGY